MVLVCVALFGVAGINALNNSRLSQESLVGTWRISVDGLDQPARYLAITPTGYVTGSEFDGSTYANPEIWLVRGGTIEMFRTGAAAAPAAKGMTGIVMSHFKNPNLISRYQYSVNDDGSISLSRLHSDCPHKLTIKKDGRSTIKTGM